MPSDRVSTPHSSNVLAYEYDEAAKRLTVHFKGGGVYDYAGVTAGTVAAMRSAPSTGHFIHTSIKPHYPAVRRR